MPSLVSARTQFGVYGGPLRRGGSFLSRVPATPVAVSDTLSVSLVQATPAIEGLETRTGYTQTYTKFGPYGGPLTASTSFPKIGVTFVELTAIDSWPVTLSEDPVDSNEIIGSDDWRLTLTDIANLRNNLAATDTLAVAVSDTISLLQAGVLTLSVTDTLSVTFTEGVGDVRVTLAVTDSLALTLTETDPATIATPLELKTATDDLNVTLSGEQANLQIFVGVVPINAFDDWRVTLQAEVAGVTVQQPIGRITFRILSKSMKFEFV